MTHSEASTLRILRDPHAREARAYDLIVIGGGIHGVCVAFEAARRGLRPLLLERNDFGGATSGNSQRIVHGGLRYLQSLDVRRLRESVVERRWFLRHMPELVRPLPCLMPLYGNGLKTPMIFRQALRLNDRLSRDRNVGVGSDCHLPDARLLNNAQTIERFPAVDQRDLRGAGFWHDAVMLSSERILIELLKWACAAGGAALNYVNVQDLVIENGRVAGVEATDGETGRTFRYHAPVVVNCTGPWSSSVARQFGGSAPVPMHPSLAFTLILDHPPIADGAISVAPKKPNARNYFLVAERGRIHAGAQHIAWHDRDDLTPPMPNGAQVDEFLYDLNTAIPGLELSRDHVLRVYSGLVPAVSAGSIKTRSRDLIVEHDRDGCPAGLFSVVGIKFTTARLVGERTVRQIFGRRPYSESINLKDQDVSSDSDVVFTDSEAALEALNQSPDRFAARVRALAEREAVVHLDDIIVRRTTWATDPRQAIEIARHISTFLGWTQQRQVTEQERLHAHLESSMPYGGMATPPAQGQAREHPGRKITRAGAVTVS